MTKKNEKSIFQLVGEYANTVGQFGPDSEQARKFRAAHADNTELMEFADAIDCIERHLGGSGMPKKKPSKPLPEMIDTTDFSPADHIMVSALVFAVRNIEEARELLWGIRDRGEVANVDAIIERAAEEGGYDNKLFRGFARNTFPALRQIDKRAKRHKGTA